MKAEPIPKVRQPYMVFFLTDLATQMELLPQRNPKPQSALEMRSWLPLPAVGSAAGAVDVPLLLAEA